MTEQSIVLSEGEVIDVPQPRELVYILTTTRTAYAAHPDLWQRVLDEFEAVRVGAWDRPFGYPVIEQVDDPQPFNLRWRVSWPVPPSALPDELDTQRYRQAIYSLATRILNSYQTTQEAVVRAKTERPARQKVKA